MSAFCRTTLPCSLHCLTLYLGFWPPVLVSATQMFNSFLPPSEAINAKALLLTPVTQKSLSSKLDDYLFKVLLDMSSIADKARLLSVSSPHADLWLSVTPSEGLGLHIDPSQFQVAIKWWPFYGSCCPLCPEIALDPLGHHAITCKRGGAVVSHHNKLRDILAESCRRAHLGVQVEMGNNLTNHSHTRPADLLVPNCKPAAFDLSVTSPLNPTTLFGRYKCAKKLHISRALSAINVLRLASRTSS